MPEETAASLCLQAVMAKWQEWPIRARPRLLKTFTAGQSHQTHLIESAHRRYVLKIFMDKQGTAIEAQRWAADLGIAPELLYSAPDFEFAIFSYLDTETLSPASADSGTLRRVSNALGKMHS
ncbi:MAG: hypothetical protein HKN85_09025, partial [Gammaproteobacteria bacterium]|nr:hypothetical protein [Gammaproteobacteria bacterium]